MRLWARFIRWLRGEREYDRVEIVEEPMSLVQRERRSWCMSRNGAPGTTLTFSRPGETAQQHFITSLHFSFNQRHVGYATLVDSYHQPRGDWYVHDSEQIPLKHPIEMAVGEEFRVTLALGGRGATVDVVPSITVVGYTE